jgi:hypothetical protein
MAESAPFSRLRRIRHCGSARGSDDWLAVPEKPCEDSKTKVKNEIKKIKDIK